MKLDVNLEKMTLLGVPFDDEETFDAVWYAVSSSIMAGWQPTVEDIKGLKEHAKYLLHEKETGENDAAS